MAKLLALLTTLLVAAHVVVAASHRATITMVETIGSDNPSRRQDTSQECQRKLRDADLDSCMECLLRKQGGGMYKTGSRGSPSLLDVCFHQLELLSDQECMCDGLKAEVKKRGPPYIMLPIPFLPKICSLSPLPCRRFGSRAF